jgi:hypothetical protein
MGPVVLEAAAEAVLGCLLELLGLRRMEPDRPGRVVIGGVEVALGPLPLTGLVLSAILSRAPPRSAEGDGECVNFSSLEADSMLVCRSSKLTEGRKS